MKGRNPRKGQSVSKLYIFMNTLIYVFCILYVYSMYVALTQNNTATWSQMLTRLVTSETSLMIASNLATSSASFWFISAIFSLNFLGLAMVFFIFFYFLELTQSWAPLLFRRLRWFLSNYYNQNFCTQNFNFFFFFWCVQ